MLLLVVVIIGSTVAAVRIATARRAEQKERERALSASHQLKRANGQLGETVTRLELQHAEDLFASGDSATAIAYLAASLRGNPTNHIAAERLASALIHRNLALRTSAPARHSERVSSVRFSPDGRHVLSASWDGTARLWDASNGQLAANPLKHSGRVVAAQFSPDGTLAATASEDGTGRDFGRQTRGRRAHLRCGMMRPCIGLSSAPTARA